MKNFKMNNKGITLIALVITIVILIILAGVLINITLGENGIISKTKEVKVQHIKAQYYEEINIEILEEQMERQTSPKSEAFIVSLDNRLKAKAWRKNSIMCDTDNNQNVDPFDNTILIIETVEDYEIYIEVDNSNNTATIVENSFKKISTPCTITYDSNGGTGTTNGPTTVRNGFKITLPENGFSKTNFEFAGWTLDSENSGKTYSAGSISDAITEDTIFYAKWRKSVVTIEYYSTNESETMETTPATVGEETTLRECTFTAPDGYEFDGWNTKADGTGDSYTNSITVENNNNASIKLYAQWKPIVYTITFEKAGVTNAIASYNGPEHAVMGEEVTVTVTLATDDTIYYTGKNWNTTNGTNGVEESSTSYNKTYGNTFSNNANLTPTTNTQTTYTFVMPAKDVNIVMTGSEETNNIETKNWTVVSNTVYYNTYWLKFYASAQHGRTIYTDYWRVTSPSGTTISNSNRTGSPSTRGPWAIQGGDTADWGGSWKVSFSINTVTSTNKNDLVLSYGVSDYGTWKTTINIYAYQKNGNSTTQMGSKTLSNASSGTINLGNDSNFYYTTTQDNYRMEIEFEKWTTNSDGTGDSYTNSITVTNNASDYSNVTIKRIYCEYID